VRWARDTYIAAANAYARVSLQVAIHNEDVKALIAQAAAIPTDALENYFEQREEFSIRQAAAAAAAIGLEANSAYHSYKSLQMRQAQLKVDQKNSIDALKAAKAAQDAACR
jgi:hypothetical protein